MGDWKGFWSYVHTDDDADQGRITRLAHDLVAQFEMLTGEKIDLFLDKASIGWGDNWRDKINESLAAIAFFIPVLTPRYFMSAECRSELQFFARKATDLGIKELVLPLLYVDVDSLHVEEPNDELISLVKNFQWEDWRDLRFVETGSEKYRRGVAHLAKKLVEANTKADQTDIIPNVRRLEGHIQTDTEEAPGSLDILATGETALPQLKTIVEAITADIEYVGIIMEQAAADVKKGDAQGKGFAARLAVARKLSENLQLPAERITKHGNEYVSLLHQVDEGIRFIIDRAPDEIAKEPDSKTKFCELFNSFRNMAEATINGLESAQGMINALATIEGISRDLRAPLRKLKQGLITMVESKSITDEWLLLIEKTEVDC